jgi:hypothetical protein
VAWIIGPLDHSVVSQEICPNYRFREIISTTVPDFNCTSLPGKKQEDKKRPNSATLQPVSTSFLAQLHRFKQKHRSRKITLDF